MKARIYNKKIRTSAHNEISKVFLKSVDWRGLASFVLPFCVYLFTVAPTIYNLDSAELTTAAATGGLMRATGYPLYLSLGYLWSKIPLGDVGFRMNLFSAFNGALTIFLADRILRRWQIGTWASLGALGLLATGTFFWGMSLVAEVYTLHTALMAGLILALLRWQERPTAGRLAQVGLITGLGLAHHAATLLLIPGVLWYITTINLRSAIQPKSLFAAMIGLAIGLSVYLYLPLRYGSQPAFNYAGRYNTNLEFIPVDLHSISGLVWLATGRTFAGQMFGYRGFDLWRETWHFGRQLSQAFFIIGIVPGVLGLFQHFKRDWREAGALVLMFGLSAGFYINYRVVDKDTMFLPAYLIWALWIGIGYQEFLTWVQKHSHPRHRYQETRLVKATVAVVVLLALGWNWRLADLSNDWSGRTRGEAILNQVQEDALVLGWWDTVPVVQYLQLVEGQRPDVQAINRFLISPEDLQVVIRREVQNRPVYINTPSDGLLQELDTDPAGPIYQVNPNH